MRLAKPLDRLHFGAPVPLERQPDGIDIAQMRRRIRAGRKVRISYQDESGKKTRRTIWPVMIGYTDAVRLVAAWCEKRKAFRHFRTDRVQNAEFLDEVIEESPANLLARWRAHMESRGVRLP